MNQYYKFIFILFLMLSTPDAFSQKEFLQSGPMVGYSEMREVLIWVQTNEQAKVKITYRVKETPDKNFSSDEIMTQKRNAFTAHLYADEVEPDKIYTYSLFINDEEINFNYPLEFKTQKLWKWREDAPDFTFAIGSCAYVNETVYDRPGNPYGGEYEIFKSINEKSPDFMIWMGDNTYLREVDWNSRTGILKRYTHTRSLPEMQPLLGSVHHYAIWDDHDYGPDNSDRGYIFKETTLEAFKLFWANPGYGINSREGITTRFEWADVDFFLLDDRYYRTPNTRKSGERVMFGDDQIQWLIDALISSRAPFKIIVTGGQMLNPMADPLRKETFSAYPEEQKKLFDLIKKENIGGVLFFTGDIHSSEISKMDREGTYPFYEFTISPLTAGVYIQKEQLNTFALPGYKTNERNFAIFSITGPKGNRVLSCTDYNTGGKEMWKFSLNENELK